MEGDKQVVITLNDLRIAFEPVVYRAVYNAFRDVFMKHPINECSGAEPSPEITQTLIDWEKLPQQIKSAFTYYEKRELPKTCEEMLEVGRRNFRKFKNIGAKSTKKLDEYMYSEGFDQRWKRT